MTAGHDTYSGVAGPALAAAMARCLDQIDPAVAAFGVAVSGGIDSAMVAVTVASMAAHRGLAVHCLHIHHGLQPLADIWQSQVHDLAQSLGVACHSLRVHVAQAQTLGLEAAARQARYDGLAQLARQVGVAHVLLGHHRDDQAETVLLRLLRGAGPGGLSAMAPVLRRDGLQYLRPWLDLDRCVLEDAARRFQEATGWQPACDPTNTEDRYTRSALRERLVPALDARWPAWRATLARHARLSAQTRDVLEEVAEQDFAALSPSADGSSVSLAAWRALSQARQALVLRHWFGRLGLQMPSERWLEECMRQLRGLHALGHDRQMQMRCGHAWLRCIRGRVQVDAAPGGCNNP